MDPKRITIESSLGMWMLPSLKLGGEAEMESSFGFIVNTRIRTTKSMLLGIVVGFLTYFLTSARPKFNVSQGEDPTTIMQLRGENGS